MIEQDTTTPKQSTPTLGPGDKLQAARISNGLTIQDVANRMHLSESILSSLEDNDFDEITAPIFVKGYLRSYARIVNLDENDIIQQYTSFYTDGDPPITSTSNTAPEINADDARVKWITWLVILGLIALLSAWWWNRYQQPAQPLSLDSTQPATDLAQSSQTDSETIFNSNPGAVSQQEQALSQQAQTDLAALSQQQSEEAIEPEPLIEPPNQSAEVPEQQQVEEPLELKLEETTPVETVPGTSSQSTNMDALESSPEPAMDINEELVLTVNADTWTDIRDADGNKLIYDLLRSGEKISVSGKTPMRAFFGNGYGITLKYQGKDLDLSAVIRPDNTARINIGQ